MDHLDKEESYLGYNMRQQHIIFQATCLDHSSLFLILDRIALFDR